MLHAAAWKWLRCCLAPGLPGLLPCFPFLTWQAPTLPPLAPQDCPSGSFAAIAGARACMACYYGVPVVVAGEGGLDADAMPTEQPSMGEALLRSCAAPAWSPAAPPEACRLLQPSGGGLPCRSLGRPPRAAAPARAAGYLVATTSASSPLSDKVQCGFAPFTAACSTMNSRVVSLTAGMGRRPGLPLHGVPPHAAAHGSCASGRLPAHPCLPLQVSFETDGSCAVTLMVLGDSDCSSTDDATTFSGCAPAPASSWAAGPTGGRTVACGTVQPSETWLHTAHLS